MRAKPKGEVASDQFDVRTLGVVLARPVGLRLRQCLWSCFGGRYIFCRCHNSPTCRVQCVGPNGRVYVHLALWFLNHYSGTLEVSVAGKLVFGKALGQSQMRLTILVQNVCDPTQFELATVRPFRSLPAMGVYPRRFSVLILRERTLEAYSCQPRGGICMTLLTLENQISM